MAASFREQSRKRKLIYAGIIVALFTGMVLHRPLVEAAARDNDLSEIDLGEVDMGGSAARFALVSFRGPLICGLWWEAVERKSKHEWEQMELVTTALTKLQPHFKGPWLYLAWDYAYNVAVEFDSIEAKYNYIAYGCKILSEGERRNRARVFDPKVGRKVPRGDPDMRWNLAFFLQQKMTTADEVDTYCILLQLSCIKYESWDPYALANDSAALNKFKENHPRMMRRFRKLKVIPEAAEKQFNDELLAFLRAYRGIPRIKMIKQDDGTFVQDHASFPYWPETRMPKNPELEQSQDAFEIALTWYEFAQEPLPPPLGKPGPQREYDRKELHVRPIPKNMFILIFRGSPARTKGLQAMQLVKEGLLEESDLPAGSGSEPLNARNAWDECYKRWHKMGKDNGMDFDPPSDPNQLSELEKLRWKSALFRTTYPDRAVSYQDLPAHVRSAAATDPKARELIESQVAYEKLSWVERNRGTTRYDHWTTDSDLQRSLPAIQAHRHFYVAANRYRADSQLARKEYEKGLALWQKTLFELRSVNLTKNSLFPVPIAHEMGLGMTLVPLSATFDVTKAGADSSILDDLVELQDDYLKVRARCDAPRWMSIMLDGWRWSRAMNYAAANVSLRSGAASFTPWALQASDPLDRRDINLAWVEVTLQAQPAPLSYFLSEELQKALVAKKAEAARVILGLPAHEPEQPPEAASATTP